MYKVKALRNFTMNKRIYGISEVFFIEDNQTYCRLFNAGKIGVLGVYKNDNYSPITETKNGQVN